MAQWPPEKMAQWRPEILALYHQKNWHSITRITGTMATRLSTLGIMTPENYLKTTIASR
jgi:hypothetical protein